MAWPCLCLEAWCFPSCAISSTRMLVMDTRNIQPDPCDSRLIRLNNFLQALHPVPRPRRARLVSATSTDCSCFAPFLMPTAPRLSDSLNMLRLTHHHRLVSNPSPGALRIVSLGGAKSQC